MSLYKQKYNALGKLGFNLVPTANVITFKAGVANQAALPLTGNSQNDARIANDTGLLYVWSIPASSGLLTDWISQGDILDYTWAGLSGKPSSTPSNIDDAVTKRHTQGTDQGLDTGGANAVTAAQAKSGYTHSSVITGNPHQVNKTDVGLGNVDNKSEATIITDVKADTDVADALTKRHAHSNQTVLDQIQEALTTVLKSAYDACVTFVSNFDISSPSIDDTLVWNGSQYVNRPLKETTGPNVTYFFDDTLSGVDAYTSLLTVPLGTAEEIDTVIVNNNEVIFHEPYASTTLGGTEINAGLWEFTIWCGTTNAGGSNFVDIDVYKRTVGGAETLLFSVSTPDLTNTQINEQNITTTQPSFAINTDDRLVVKVYGRTTGGTNRTMSFVHNGTSRYSHFHTPLILRHNDLAGLNEGDYKHLTAAEYLPIPTLASDITDISLNVMLNAFRIAQIGSLTIFGMVKGFMDEYEDESGIDLGNSSGQTYDSTNDYYKNYGDTDAETVLLLHLDNTTVDSEITPKTVTNNNVTFSSLTKKFGTHSAQFNGTTSYLSIPDSDDWDFGSGDFTIDFWARFNVKDITQVIISQYVDSSTFITCRIGGNNHIYFIAYSGSGLADYYTSAFTIDVDTWYHIALVRNGSNFYIFVDGISQSLTTTVAIGSNSMPNLSSPLSIGQIGDLSQWLDGYLDEIRVSKGIARWTSNFIPAVTQYPIYDNMILQSNVQVATIIPVSSRIVLFEEDVDSVTLNTDLKAYISRDNGTTFTQVTLEDEGNYITGARILSGIVDISAQPSGSNMKYKIETLNMKKMNVHGTSVSWK